MLKQLEAEATDAEQKQLLHMDWGTDFGSPRETAVAERFDRPVFVYHYPTAVKAFYMQPVAGSAAKFVKVLTCLPPKAMAKSRAAK